MWRFIICSFSLLSIVSCMSPHMNPQLGSIWYESTNSSATVYNTEEYDRIYENEFMSVSTHPLSTFSIDVDAASYGNVRRFINDSELPPKDAVRIEELINYFNYDYPVPGGEDPFTISTEISTCPWYEEHRLVHIGLQSAQIEAANLPPNNLVFLIDVSGSMAMPRKLPLLKAAFRMLVDQLREVDRVAIVVYAGAAGLVLPSTPGSDKERILQAIDHLEAGGSTAGGAGIKLAYAIAQENILESGNNRVILATDGDFNVGVSSNGEMVRLVEEKRGSGVYLTVLGFGMGNLKDSKLEQLADKGNGNYAYIDNILEARKTLVTELGATLLTVAKDVKIQVEFNAAKVSAYRLIGYENRLLDRSDFADDSKDAGDMGAGHSVTALYEVIPTGASGDAAKTDTLRYQVVGVRPEALASAELMNISCRYKKPGDSVSQLLVRPVIDSSVQLSSTSDDYRFSAAVAAFGMLLRESQFSGEASFQNLLDLARGSLGDDQEGYRKEFVRLVESCGHLSGRLD